MDRLSKRIKIKTITSEESVHNKNEESRKKKTGTEI